MKQKLVNFFIIALMVASCGKLAELEDGESEGDGDGIDKDTEHRIFVTSTTYKGQFTIASLTGLDAADALCNSVASSAGLSLNYKAILSSTTVDANDRIDIKGAVYKIDSSDAKIKVVDDENDFWNADNQNFLSKVHLDESGNAQTINPWTGTQAAGVASSGLNFCTDWTSDSGVVNGDIGSINSVDENWLENGTADCSTLRPIFCISQDDD